MGLGLTGTAFDAILGEDGSPRRRAPEARPATARGVKAVSVMLFAPRDLGALLALSAHGGRVAAATLKGDAVTLRRAAVANARAYREQYGEETVPPSADEIGVEAAGILSGKTLPAEEDALKGFTLGWEGASCGMLLAYNCVTNGGRDFLPADVAQALCPVLVAATEGCRVLGVVKPWEEGNGPIPARPHDGCPVCARERQS